MKSIPWAAKVSRARRRWETERANLSNFHTTTTSNFLVAHPPSCDRVPGGVPSSRRCRCRCTHRRRPSRDARSTPVARASASSGPGRRPLSIRVRRLRLSGVPPFKMKGPESVAPRSLLSRLRRLPSTLPTAPATSSRSPSGQETVFDEEGLHVECEVDTRRRGPHPHEVGNRPVLPSALKQESTGTRSTSRCIRLASSWLSSYVCQTGHVRECRGLDVGISQESRIDTVRLLR